MRKRVIVPAVACAALVWATGQGVNAEGLIQEKSIPPASIAEIAPPPIPAEPSESNANNTYSQNERDFGDLFGLDKHSHSVESQLPGHCGSEAHSFDGKLFNDSEIANFGSGGCQSGPGAC